MNRLNSQFANVSLNPNSSRRAGLTSRNTSMGYRPRDITPSRNSDFSGTMGEGDRYIPTRSAEHFEFANNMLSGAGASFFANHNESVGLNTSMSAPSSPTKKHEANIKKKLMRAKSSGDLSSLTNINLEDERILAFKKGAAPSAPAGYQNHQRVVYSTMKPSSSVKKPQRRVPTTAERILDAPGIIDDFYLNLTDWSSQNIVAVSLGESVFLWNAATGDIECLFDLGEESTIYVSSVKWTADGFFLAVGLSDGCTKIFDIGQKSCVRTIKSQSSRISTSAWNQHLLSCASRTGQVYNHDVRQSNHFVSMFSAHQQEVCGLDWDPAGIRLASAGGDGLVCVWDSNTMSANCERPLHTLNQHISTVKAVKFCPYKTNILVSGGGAQDRTIKTWSYRDGSLLSSVDTGSQVTGILFNKDYQEMVTSHGMPDHVLKVWKYSAGMQLLGDLKGHSDRVLNICQSPCNQFVMSASSDETLRLWHTWKMDESVRRQLMSDVPYKSSALTMKMNIR